MQNNMKNSVLLNHPPWNYSTVVTNKFSRKHQVIEF